MKMIIILALCNLFYAVYEETKNDYHAAEYPLLSSVLATLLRALFTIPIEIVRTLNSEKARRFYSKAEELLNIWFNPRYRFKTLPTQEFLYWKMQADAVTDWHEKQGNKSTVKYRRYAMRLILKARAKREAKN